jgi:hypothetical protein
VVVIEEVDDRTSGPDLQVGRQPHTVAHWLLLQLESRPWFNRSQKARDRDRGSTIAVALTNWYVIASIQNSPRMPVNTPASVVGGS